MARPEGRLFGKVALVTGAGRGIGRAVALAYARAGASLVMCSRTRRELDACAAQAPGSLTKACDVAEPKQVKSLVRAALGRFGRVDILVNNAGILGPRVPLAAVSRDDWEAVLGINLGGVFLVTREVLNSCMLKRGRGCVINVSSGVGRRGRAGWGPYAVSKFGVEGLTQVWADECREGGVRFYSLNPGPTRTRMRGEAYPDEDPNALKAPEAVAEAFVALAEDACAVPTGAALELDPAMGRLLRP